MASDYYNPSDNDKYVSDGDTCYADDLNKVNNATNAGFESVEVDVDSAIALAIENAGLSKEWAANDQGDLPSNPVGSSPNTDKYSSRANAIEAKGWVMADYPGEDPYTEANGNAFTERGAKILAEECASDAADAVAAAAIAIATNSISAGNGIDVIKTGTDPYDYEVSIGNSNRTIISANHTGAQTVLTNTNTVINFDNEIEDNLGEFTPASGFFTADFAGKYLVVAHIAFEQATWNANNRAMINLIGPGTISFSGPSFHVGAGSLVATAAISTVVSLEAAESLVAYVYHNRTGGSAVLRTDAGSTYLNITRVA